MQNKGIPFIGVVVLLILMSSTSWGSETYLYRIDLTNRGGASPLVETGIEVLNVIPNDHALAELTLGQVTRLIRMGYRVDYEAPSLQQYSVIDETDDYYNYESVTNQLQDWANQYSDIAQLFDLGTTVQNHHVWGVKVSDNPVLEEDEIVCYYVGCHHGNEWISVEVPMFFLNFILESYGVNPDVTYWVDNREIWVIPVLNPDGYVNNIRYNANDVDLNRNYSFHWGEFAYNYGPYPFSEIETQAVRDLNLEHHFTVSHSYHSYGEVIIYPFVWTADYTPDDSLFQEISWAMFEPNGYQPWLHGIFHPHGGDHDDYLYAEQGVIAVTSELWSGPEFNPPSSLIINVCVENLPNDLYLLERAGGSQITGCITDSSTGEPLVAQCKILECWDPDEIYPRNSEPDFGRYRHLLTAGVYTFEVSREGYLTRTISNIEVVDGQPTEVDVALMPFDVQIALSPVNPPIVIPPAGGSFEYSVEIVNNSATAQIADVWIDLTVPSGITLDPFVLIRNLSMPPGWSNLRLLFQRVPGALPAGTYTMNACVGDYDSTLIMSADHFDVIKEGLETGDFAAWLAPLCLNGENSESVRLSDICQLAVDVTPNPFNLTTVLSFQLPVAGRVKLDIFDINGRRVGVGLTPTRQYPPGTHHILFDGSGLPAGIYLARLTAEDFSQVRKLVLMK
jgi:hypothetical protein